MKPSVLVFARRIDDGLVSLIKRLDAFAKENAAKNVRATVVLLDDGKNVAKDLAAIAEKNGIENVPLTIADQLPNGPPAYKITKDVPFTVVVYNNKKKITDSFGFDALDAKSRNQSLSSLAQATGVAAPAAEGEKTSAPSDKSFH
jgi:hypothetical protein